MAKLAPVTAAVVEAQLPSVRATPVARPEPVPPAGHAAAALLAPSCYNVLLRLLYPHIPKLAKLADVRRPSLTE